MAKNSFYRGSSLGALVACFGTSLALAKAGIVSQQQGKDLPPPNVIFILADDMGYGELGCYGQKEIKTPNIDKLAEQGIRLTRHYSGSPVCAPSRCVLLTGKHPGHAFVRDNKDKEIGKEGQLPLPPSESTFGSDFKNAGYTTAVIGKWGLGMPHNQGDPHKHGFDHFFGYYCQRHAHSHYPETLWSDLECLKLENQQVSRRGRLKADSEPKAFENYIGKDYVPEKMREDMLKWIDSNKSKPFMLYYASPLPHVSLQIPQEELKQYEGKFDEKPFWGDGYTPNRTPKATYAAMISYLDQDVGLIMKKLAELGLDENTIIVFSSDNGATIPGCGGARTDYFKSNGSLRNYKGAMFEGGIRVPAIVKWPGVTKPGTTSDCLSGFEDWRTTFAALVSKEKTAVNLGDGRNLRPELSGDAQNGRKFLYREFRGYDGQQSVWLGKKWKGLRNGINKATQVPEIKLFNLEADPGEKTNIAQKHPDIVKEIEEIMKKEHTPSSIFTYKVLGE